MFKKNVGLVDRAIRIVIGIMLLSLVFVGPQTALGWIGLVPLVTGAMGTCGLYSVFGMSTCKTSLG